MTWKLQVVVSGLLEPVRGVLLGECHIDRHCPGCKDSKLVEEKECVDDENDRAQGDRQGRTTGNVWIC